jgi:hypothetical protein
LIGATFSSVDLASDLGRGAFTAATFSGACLATAGFAGTGLAAGTGLGAGLFGFTVTFDVAGDGLDFAGGRSTFLAAAALGVAALGVAFLGVALPGRLAALLGFFEGI